MAFDASKPIDSGLLINFPAQARSNWEALELGTDSGLLVTNAKVSASADIAESKLLFSASGHAHTGGTGGKNIALTTGVTGVLPIANGGTNLSSAGGNANRVLLTTDGTAYSMAQVNLTSMVTGTLPTGNGGTGATANANAANGVVIPTGAVNEASGVVVLDASSKLPAVDGSQLTGITTQSTAGDNQQAAADTEQQLPGSSYQKVKEIIVPANGTLRIKCAIHGGGGTGYGKIYRNGSPVGTERSVGAAYTTFSEDIAGWSAGDLCQFYGYSTSPVGSGVKEFRIYEGGASDYFVNTD